MKIGYQIKSKDNSWYGHHVWTSKEWAESVREHMNKDRLEWEAEYILNEVEIEGEPF